MISRLARANIMAMQIIVIGMHRSGTSLAAQLLKMLGAYAGDENDLLPATADNRKGYLERRDVVELNEYVLDGCGNKWFEVSDFNPSRLEPARKTRFEQEAGRIVARLNERGTWFLKDPRMCVTLPLWIPFMDRPAAVFVHRDPVSVAMSLRKRDHLPVFFSVALWEAYTVSALRETIGIPRTFLGFEDIVARPRDAANRVLSFAGSLGDETLHAPPEREVASVVDGGLINHKLDPRDLDLLTPPQLRLHNRLIGLSRDGAPPEEEAIESKRATLSDGSLEVLRYYESVNRIERTRRSRSKTLKHLWRLLREGKSRD